MKNEHAGVRIVAAKALAKIGSASILSAANLSVALKAPSEKRSSEEWDAYIRLAIAIGKNEGGLLDALSQVLDSPRFSAIHYENRDIRANHWLAVAAVIPPSGAGTNQAHLQDIESRIVETLQEITQDENAEQLTFVGVARAAEALRETGKRAVQLLMIASQKNWRSGSPIVKFSGKISYSSTPPELEAVRAMGRIRKPAESALPLLHSIANRKESDSKKMMAEGLYSQQIQAANEAIRKIRAADEERD